MKKIEWLLIVAGYMTLLIVGTQWYTVEKIFDSCAKEGRAKLSERLEIDCLPVEEIEK